MPISSHLCQVRLQTWGKCEHFMFFYVFENGWRYMMLNTFTQHLHYPLLYMDVGGHLYFFQMRIIVTFGS